MKEYSLQSLYLCELQIVERQVGIQVKYHYIFYSLLIYFLGICIGRCKR